MSRYREKFTRCPNCGTSLREYDHFCPNCGQENHGLKIPFKHLFLELFESVFHFETKFFTTLRLIFTRPGQISVDFWDGKRARYMHPFRLYLFVSVLFFLAANKIADRSAEQIGNTIETVQRNPITRVTNLRTLVGATKSSRNDSILGSAALKDFGSLDLNLPVDSVARYHYILELKKPNVARLDSLLNENQFRKTTENRNKFIKVLSLVPDKTNIPSKLSIGSIVLFFNTVEEDESFTRKLKSFSDSQVDSVLISINQKPGYLNRTLLKQGVKLDVGDARSLHDITHLFIKNLSFVMFVLMPVVAFFLLFVFYGRKRFYFEHLIFSIHAHTILFILCAVALTIDYFANASWIFKVTFWINWIYFLLSIKRVYQQSWLLTIFKFLVLSLLYLVIVFVFMAAAFLWGFMTF